MRKAQWQLLEFRPAWEGNWSSDSFISFAWELDDERLLVAVNYSSNQAQCYVKLPFANLAGACWQLQDLMEDAVYEREESDLYERVYISMSRLGRQWYSRCDKHERGQTNS